MSGYEDFRDMIHANVATYPARKDVLPLMIKSVIDQVDLLHVSMNGYEKGYKPPYLDHPKILLSYLDNSLTDAAKYYRVRFQSGYIFTMDDDLEYAPDYVQYMISKIEQYQRKAVVTLHGRAVASGRISPAMMSRSLHSTVTVKRG